MRLAARLLSPRCTTSGAPFVSSNPSALLVKHVSQPIPRLGSIAPHLEGCAELQELIDAGLSKKPQDRIPSARDYLERIDAVLALDLPEASGSFEPVAPDDDLMEETLALTTSLPPVDEAGVDTAIKAKRRHLTPIIVVALVAALAFLAVLWSLGVLS